jgi:hypothetical protein
MKKATLQSDHVVAQLKTNDGHASRNALKRHQSIIEGTSNPSFQSSPNSTHNPSPMYNETPRLSSRPATLPLVPTFERPMTKFEMLQSQSKSLATIANNLKANVEDRKTMLRAKVDVSIEKKMFLR